MANELRGVTATGSTCYALIVNSVGKFWNGTAFEDYDSGSYSDYDIAMTEQGVSGIFLGNFPSGITASGTYEYFVKRQLTGSVQETDPVINTGKVDWTGSSSATYAVGSMTGSDFYDYVLRQGFKRTDKSTEVYEAITDAIREMRRRFMFDEAEVEAVTTDSISILGDYQLSLESDFGLLLGVTIEDGTNATPLKQVTKSKFNDLYPDINVTADRGYPLNFTVYAGSIQIGPAPDQVSYSYRVTYSQRGGTVSASTTGVPFTALYRHVLCDTVLSRLFYIMEDFDKGNFYKQRFEDQFLLSVRRERMNSGESVFNQEGFYL